MPVQPIGHFFGKKSIFKYMFYPSPKTCAEMQENQWSPLLFTGKDQQTYQVRIMFGQQFQLATALQWFIQSQKPALISVLPW